MQTYESILTAMQETYTRLSGANPADASDIGIRIKILAEQIWQLSQAVNEAEKQAFPQTADGVWLELHAQQRGLSRKAAVPSAGWVTFSRTAAAPNNIEIGSGVLLASKGEESVRFVTTQGVVLAAGKTEVQAPVSCETSGKAGNLAADRLTVMVTPVQGIVQVNNPQPIGGGAEEETDPAFRQRLLDSYRALTNGTNSAFYYNCAMSYPGVSSARIIPRIHGVGTVGIILHGPGVTDGLIQKMKTEIGAMKELNVDLSIEKAIEKSVALKAEIAVKEGYGFEDIAARCKEGLTALLARQKVGRSLLGAHLIQQLLECEGVANCRILEPTADRYPLEKEILILSTVTMTQMAIQV